MIYQKQSVILSPAQLKALSLKCFKRDGYICQGCGMGTIEQLVAHHIILRSRLRLDILENLLTVCSLCHIPKIHGSKDGLSVEIILDRYRYRLEEYL